MTPEQRSALKYLLRREFSDAAQLAFWVERKAHPEGEQRDNCKRQCEVSIRRLQVLSELLGEP